MPVKKISKDSVKALSPKETIWDTELKGFGCRCQKDGKFFILKYTVNNRQRFYTIGQWSGALTAAQAREEAEILRGKIRAGIDPMAEKQKNQAIPLLKTAFEKYLEEVEAKRSKRTYREYKRLFEKIINKEIGSYQLNAVAREDIARIHNKMSKTPYQANRILAVLSSFFGWCIKRSHKTEGENPCTYIEKYTEKPRERFLSEEEFLRLGKALNEYEDQFRYIRPPTHQKKVAETTINTTTSYITSAIRLLIFTGARKEEILSLKWSDVNFEKKYIHLNESKTGQGTIYLSAPALQILSELPRINGNPYVICGRNEGEHLVNIKDAWSIIRKSANLEDVRIHDLRHSYASAAVTSGHHLKVIGSLLRHKNTSTTERYAHVSNNPLQTANESISQRILDAMTPKENAYENIIKL